MVLPKRKNKGKLLKKLGTMRGFTPYNYLKAIKDGKIFLHEMDQFDSLLKMVIYRRLDGAYINIDIANYILRNKLKKSKALVFDSSLPHTKSNYNLVTLKYANIIKKFNVFLEKEKKLIEKLRKKYNLN